MPANLETIVQRMIDAGEDESSIADVIQHYNRTTPAAVAMNTTASSGPVSGSELPLAANAARAGAVRAGEELATNPKVGNAIRMASKPAAQMIARAVGVTGGLPGYIASEVLTHPAFGRAVETGVRAGGRALAAAAGSGVARALTGVGATAMSIDGLPLNATPAGERPGEAAQRSEQDIAARQFMADVNRQAGRRVITGNTTREIIESIANYNKGTR